MTYCVEWSLHFLSSMLLVLYSLRPKKLVPTAFFKKGNCSTHDAFARSMHDLKIQRPVPCSFMRMSGWMYVSSVNRLNSVVRIALLFFCFFLLFTKTKKNGGRGFLLFFSFSNALNFLNFVNLFTKPWTFFKSVI